MIRKLPLLLYLFEWSLDFYIYFFLLFLSFSHSHSRLPFILLAHFFQFSPLFIDKTMVYIMTFDDMGLSSGGMYLSSFRKNGTNGNLYWTFVIYAYDTWHACFLFCLVLFFIYYIIITYCIYIFIKIPYFKASLNLDFLD